MIVLMRAGAPQLVLASSSPTRASMLTACGLRFDIHPARIDESEIIAAMRAQKAPPRDIADALAERKCLAVARKATAAMVIGADQVLECDGHIFEKPVTREDAARQLRHLSGRTHQLVSAAVVTADGAVIWRHVDRATLTMRPLSDEFITAYLDSVGDQALHSVGSYAVEGLGAQLFTAIAGDHFTILGLPLLPLLDLLRRHGVLST